MEDKLILLEDKLSNRGSPDLEKSCKLKRKKEERNVRKMTLGKKKSSMNKMKTLLVPVLKL